MKLDNANDDTISGSESEEEPKQSKSSPESSKSSPKSSAQSSSSSPKSSRSTIELHIPGVNDIMTGGMGTSSYADAEPNPLPASIDNSEYDATVGPFAINEAVTTMPFKILSQHDMAELDLFEGNLPAVLDDDVKITILGLQRATDEAHGLMDTNAGTEEWDEILMGTMMKRLGRFSDEDERDVQYVDDLVPVAIEDGDEEYWALVNSQGKVWEELGLEADS